MENIRGQEFKMLIQPTEIEGEIIETSPGLDKMLEFTSDSLDKVLNYISTSAMTFTKALNQIKEECNADGATIEFGVSCSAEGNAFIAKASANASLKVTLVWEPNRSNK